ncbi:MAG TPA: family 1 glycosylhydrolase, partial [Bacillota bacterium]|nr:family 1 glycosylhydrolase [Bacillota bacterium]
LYDLLKYLHEEYHGIKMFITENGAAFKDNIDDDGNVEDDERINYLHEHMIQAHRAIGDGVRLAGYYVWSLMDNFEWRLGYSKRFGLVYIDYGTQSRIVKKSGWWFKQVIEDNGL